MRDEINNDNLYKEGTIIYAKKEPTIKLLIGKYRQRIYYCSVANDPNQNNLAYFESELIPPYSLGSEVKFLSSDTAPQTNEKQPINDSLIKAPE